MFVHAAFFVIAPSVSISLMILINREFQNNIDIWIFFITVGVFLFCTAIKISLNKVAEVYHRKKIWKICVRIVGSLILMSAPFYIHFMYAISDNHSLLLIGFASAILILVVIVERFFPKNKIDFEQLNAYRMLDMDLENDSLKDEEDELIPLLMDRSYNAENRYKGSNIQPSAPSFDAQKNFQTTNGHSLEQRNFVRCFI